MNLVITGPENNPGQKFVAFIKEQAKKQHFRINLHKTGNKSKLKLKVSGLCSSKVIYNLDLLGKNNEHNLHK